MLRDETQGWLLSIIANVGIAYEDRRGVLLPRTALDLEMCS